MSRKPVLVQLSDDLLDRLDRLSDEHGRSRSAVVREAIVEYVTHHSRESKDRRMAEAYAAAPDDKEFDRWAAAGANEMVDEEPW